MTEPEVRRYPVPDRWTGRCGSVREVDIVLADLWADECVAPSAIAFSPKDARSFMLALVHHHPEPLTDRSGVGLYGQYLDKFACGSPGRPPMVDILRMPHLPRGTFLVALPCS